MFASFFIHVLQNPRLTHQLNLLSMVIAERKNLIALQNCNANYSIGASPNCSLAICVLQYSPIHITSTSVLHYGYISNSYSLALCNLVSYEF